jgi:hypothetical protein
MSQVASISFTLTRPDRPFYMRLASAWFGLVGVAVTYCLLHGYIAGTPYGSLEIPVKWAFGNWGSWPLLLPLCFMLVKSLCRRMSTLPAVLLVMPVAILGASLFHQVFHSLWGDPGDFIGILYYMTPIAGVTYGLFAVLAFWLMGPVMLNPATREARDTEPTASPKNLQASKGQMQASLPVEDIQWIQGARNYVELMAGSDTYIMRASMKDLESRLADSAFLRAHRSYLVNRAYIEGVVRGRNGEPMLKMKGGDLLPIGRAYRESSLAEIGFVTEAA